MNTPLARAVKICGNQTKLAAELAELLGKPVCQADVWHWMHEAKKGTPAEYCFAIEQLTGVSAKRLRPDVFIPPSKRKK